MIGGGVSAGLWQQLMKSRWRRFTLRLSSLVEVGLAGLRLAFLPAVALLVLALMVPALWRELQKAEPQAALVTALVSLILVAAVAAQLGGALLGRLKKLGPLELFGRELSSLVATLDRIDPQLKLSTGQGPLPPDVAFSYRELDRFVSQLEFSNQPLEGRYRERFYRLLRTVAGAAMRQEEWWKARARLELLVRLSDGKYQPGKIFYDLGIACMQCALSTQDEKKAEEDLREAARHLRRARELTPLDYKPHFFLGFVLAQLELYERAVEAIDGALELQPRLAQAKYNKAVCQVKLGSLGLAYSTLRTIEDGDEGADRAGREGLSDPELAELRGSRIYGASTVRILEHLSAAGG